jgi:hypothetical protein
LYEDKLVTIQLFALAKSADMSNLKSMAVGRGLVGLQSMVKYLNWEIVNGASRDEFNPLGRWNLFLKTTRSLFIWIQQQHSVSHLNVACG